MRKLTTFGIILFVIILVATGLYFFTPNSTFSTSSIYNKLNSNSELGNALFSNKDISLIKKSEFLDIDVCVLNPPFGTTDVNKKLDVVFLKKAIKLSNKFISMHKTASKSFIEQTIQDEGFQIIYNEDFLFSIPKTYSHHTQGVVDVEVTLFIAEKQ